MTIHATTRSHAGRPPRRGRGAFTLLEVLLSTAIVVVLLGGVVGTMFLAQRSMAAGTDAADRMVTEARVTQMIDMDVSLATAIPERTNQAVTLVVPDRTGDGQSETIRYAWSGVPGDPLTRQFNGGAAAVIAANVYQFNLTYLYKTLGP